MNRLAHIGGFLLTVALMTGAAFGYGWLTHTGLFA